MRTGEPVTEGKYNNADPVKSERRRPLLIASPLTPDLLCLLFLLFSKKNSRAGRGGSHLSFQHFERPQQKDSLRPGIQDHPGQHSEAEAVFS
ncbi:uncharacterized protein [Macaca nemestrina]|uniref:uncharacterized protein isoform X2 n=1 Tax=Macaca nemestrina TaxID=9545 RepID=UPI0039B90F2E